MLSQPQSFRCPINPNQVKVKAIDKVNVPVDEKHDAQALNDALIEFANCLKGNAKSRPRKLETLTNHAENYLKKFSKTLHISASDFVQKALEKDWIEVSKSNGIVYHLKNKTIK